MKILIKRITIFVAVLLLTGFHAKVNAQFAISNTDMIPQLKTGTTHIAMKDTTSAVSKEYMEIFKKYWTFSPIKFIHYADIEKYIAPESFFFTIGGYETSTQFIHRYSDGSSMTGINYSNTHIYLELWGCNAKYFAKNEKKKKIFSDGDQVPIARIELFTDFYTLMQPKNIFSTDYAGDGHIRNWGKGILKNYLQQLMKRLNDGKKVTLNEHIVNTEKLQELKTQTLNVPDYVLIKFNKFTGDETKKHSEKDVFDDYDYKYQLLTTEELNNKILNDKEPFYYMIYIKSSTDKFITIFNSQTGDIIYTSYTGMSYNIKDNDLGAVSRKIK